MGGGLREELALPQRLGGMGIPCTTLEARLRAADQWAYRDAVEAGMLRENAVAAYRRPEGALDNSFMAPIGMDAHDAAVSEVFDKVPDGTSPDRWRWSALPRSAGNILCVIGIRCRAGVSAA